MPMPSGITCSETRLPSSNNESKQIGKPTESFVGRSEGSVDSRESCGAVRQGLSSVEGRDILRGSEGIGEPMNAVSLSCPSTPKNLGSKPVPEEPSSHRKPVSSSQHISAERSGPAKTTFPALGTLINPDYRAKMKSRKEQSIKEN